MKKTGTSLVKLVNLPKITDDCTLVFVESNKHIPFAIKRVYYILDAAVNLSRGRHAHKKLRQILFCIRGSIKITLDDGEIKDEVVLSSPEVGVYLDKMMWHEMKEFSRDTILLIFASDYFNIKDYIRDYDRFLLYAKKNRKS